LARALYEADKGCLQTLVAAEQHAAPNGSISAQEIAQYWSRRSDVEQRIQAHETNFATGSAMTYRQYKSDTKWGSRLVAAEDQFDPWGDRSEAEITEYWRLRNAKLG
jgi:hypothetical protein